jgi:hypothetical protein
MPSLPSWLRGRPSVPTRRPCLGCELLEARDVPSSVSGAVFDDQNGNGSLDAGEPGLAGWTVFLDPNRNTLVDPGEAAAVTDAAGTYAFDIAEPAGSGTSLSYVLQVGDGGRWLNTTPTFALSDPATESEADRNFGARFQPYVGYQPAGSETRVNDSTAGPKSTSAVAADAAGNYVVAWRTYVPNGTDTISARVYSADGTPRTEEFVVGTGTTPLFFYGQLNAFGREPKLAVAGNGRFVVSWLTRNAQTGNDTVLARVYQPSGAAATGVFTVAAAAKNTTHMVTGAAADADGDFVVLYSSRGTQPLAQPTWALKAQRYSAAGSAVGKVINVVTPNLIDLGRSVGMDGAGNFVVVWQEVGASYAQRYTSGGQAAGAQITVPGSGDTRLSMNAAGRWAVTWNVTGGRRLQGFHPDGTAAGGPVDVAAGAGPIAVDAAGDVTLIWTDARQPLPPGSSVTYGVGEVRALRVTATGEVIPETIVNTTTQGAQAANSVAATGSGSFVVTWQGNGPGDDDGVFAQRFGPTASPLDAAGGVASGTIVGNLTRGALHPIVQEAIRRWNLTGLTAAERRLLKTVQFQIADLDGATLGKAAGSTVTVDRDAAGYGWFVDSTPRSDFEFRRPEDQGEQRKMDLLTAVVHELGHVLGRDHEADGAMAETLAVGTRAAVASDLRLTPPDQTGPTGWFLARGRGRR